MSAQPDSEITDRLAAIRARLDTATPGPWETKTPGHGFETPYLCVQLGEDERYSTLELEPPDAALIAHAPADLAWLCDVAEAAEVVTRVRLSAERMESDPLALAVLHLALTLEQGQEV